MEGNWLRKRLLESSMIRKRSRGVRREVVGKVLLMNSGITRWQPTLPHADAVITQMVTQGGFLPIYLQPMDFNQLYQEKKKEQLTQSLEKEPLKKLDEALVFRDHAIN